MTYAVLASLFVAGGAILALAATLIGRVSRRWWLSTLLVGLLLLVLTAVFDTLMIVADLFRYDESALLGPRVLLVPVEDFAWPVFAVLAVPALWELLGRRGPREVRDER